MSTSRCKYQTTTTKDQYGNKYVSRSKQCLVKSIMKPEVKIVPQLLTDETTSQLTQNCQEQIDEAVKLALSKSSKELSGKLESFKNNVMSLVTALQQEKSYLIEQVTLLSQQVNQLSESNNKCKNSFETQTNKLSSLMEEAKAYQTTIEQMKIASEGKSQEYEDKLNKASRLLSSVRDECENKQKEMMNESKEFEKQVKAAQEAIQTAGDYCFINSSNARECVRKIRRKYPNVAGMLIDESHQLEGIITTGGKLFVIPPNIRVPLIDSIIKSSIPAKLDTDDGLIDVDLIVVKGSELSTPVVPVAPPLNIPTAPPLAPPLNIPTAPPLAPPLNIPTAPPLAPPLAPLLTQQVPVVSVSSIQAAPPAMAQSLQQAILPFSSKDLQQVRLRKTESSVAPVTSSSPLGFTAADLLKGKQKLSSVGMVETKLDKYAKEKEQCDIQKGVFDEKTKVCLSQTQAALMKGLASKRQSLTQDEDDEWED